MISDSFHVDRKISTLIENRTVFTANHSELNLFETYEVAQKVSLTFQQPVIASMMQGKKIMHLSDKPSFDFYPGESVVLAPGQEMIIDFPEAKKDQPTQCLALTIEQETIAETIAYFNDAIQIENDHHEIIEFGANSNHLNQNKDVDILLTRLLNTFTATNNSKDVLLDLMIKELIVRLLQTKAKHSLLVHNTNSVNNNRIAYIINFIKANLHEALTISQLANKAYMSTSQFYKTFRNTIGESPIDFINTERIKLAKKLILTTNLKLSTIAYQTGFNSVSYFNRQFKKLERMTPKEYRLRLRS